MEYEPSGPFITSVLELKLDTNTMFEWQKQSQGSPGVPHYQKLLEFVNLRAQVSESSVGEQGKRQPKIDGGVSKKPFSSGKSVSLFSASAADATVGRCVLCKTEKHPLYACAKLKSMTREKMLSTLKENNLCLNCLRSGHFLRQCKSTNRCRVCQKPHHTLLHVDAPPPPSDPSHENPIATNTAVGVKSNTLLMTCRVLVEAPDGSSVEARALLDSASSASFVSERLAQSLCLPRSRQNARISGIAGISPKPSVQSVTCFSISATQSPGKKFDVTAVVVPRVTCDLPLHPTPLDSGWNHLTGIQLADPKFGSPGKIDILLGVDVFVEVVRHGRRIGSPGTPVGFETEFGWVLAGTAETTAPTSHVATHHSLVASGDDLLRKFWEVEEPPLRDSTLSPEERSVVQHFETHHFHADCGRFVVPLPKKPYSKALRRITIPSTPKVPLIRALVDLQG